MARSRYFLSRCFLTGVAAALVAAGTAQATVSVNAVEPKTVPCGSSIKLGVWYQSFSGGSRAAIIEIDNAHGEVVWTKHVNATESWQYWHYSGHCGESYTAIYKTDGHTTRFPFHVI